MTAGIRLIVGLGNPTARYEKTRHNVGFWFLDRVALQLRIALRDEARFQGILGRSDGGKPLLLLKPSTFMNHSGRSVASVASYFKIAPSEILVSHDDLDLMPGVVRVKKGGGHGGHNGLRDIMLHLGTPDFYRLRFGIGHPGERSEVVNYVLAPPLQGEAVLLDEAITRALVEALVMVRGEMAQVMGRLNSADRIRKKGLT